MTAPLVAEALVQMRTVTGKLQQIAEIDDDSLTAPVTLVTASGVYEPMPLSCLLHAVAKTLGVVTDDLERALVAAAEGTA